MAFKVQVKIASNATKVSNGKPITAEKCDMVWYSGSLACHMKDSGEIESIRYWD